MIDIKAGGTIQELVCKHSIVLFQFSSKSCTPCVAIRQRLEDWLSNHEQIEARHISIDEHPDSRIATWPSTYTTTVGNDKTSFCAASSGYSSMDICLASICS